MRAPGGAAAAARATCAGADRVPAGQHDPVRSARSEQDGGVMAGVGACRTWVGMGVHQDGLARCRLPDRRDHLGQEPPGQGGPDGEQQSGHVTGEDGQITAGDGARITPGARPAPGRRGLLGPGPARIWSAAAQPPAWSAPASVYARPHAAQKQTDSSHPASEPATPAVLSCALP